jgi:transposase
LIESEALLGLPGYQITELREVAGWNWMRAVYTGSIYCPHCGGENLRTKDKRLRKLRHENWGERRVMIELESRKYTCRACVRSFWQRFPGIRPGGRATEPYRKSVYRKHYDGISRSRLSQREGISGSTVERWFLEFLQLSLNERSNTPCPQVLGIDEHFFSRRHGYATTLCDLKAHRINDVVLGRSEASLESYLNRLEGKPLVKVVCMDLASVYRALVRKHFPNARIVADRFHVIHLINHQFLACWKEIDPAGSKNRGLLSLMRRHRHNLRPEQQARLAQFSENTQRLR